MLKKVHQVQLGRGLTQQGERSADLPTVVCTVVEHMGQRGGKGQRGRGASHGGVGQLAIKPLGWPTFDQGSPIGSPSLQRLAKPRAVVLNLHVQRQRGARLGRGPACKAGVPQQVLAQQQVVERLKYIRKELLGIYNAIP